MKTKKFFRLMLLVLAVFVISALFFISRKTKPSENSKLERKIAGGIIPHDTSVEFITIELLKMVSLQKPKLVILLGPNHFEAGNDKITVFQGDWQISTEEKVESDENLVDELLQSGLIGVNNAIFLKEHAIGVNMIYLHNYLPGTKVVPIIFKKGCSLEELKKLADYLEARIDKDSVLLASIDFSHYLSLSEAEKMDEITLREIRNLNYEKILRFDSKNLDSPPALIVLLMLMQKQNKQDFNVLHHVNSAEIKKSAAPPTTSYFSIVFY